MMKVLKVLQWLWRGVVLAVVLSVPVEAAARNFVVTLDPGHGGRDFGAVGTKANEKDINLEVVKRTGRLIEKRLGKNVDVSYTRTSDLFVPLADRAEMANRAGADLFVSVHVNSVDRKNRNRANIEGCSVYTLGLHKTAANLEVARRENSVMELEAGHSDRYAAFDPNSLEGNIMLEISQNNRLDRSIEMADAVEMELAASASRQPKGVRQAGFYVLWAASMPAILIELDYICNPRSEQYLTSDKGLEEMSVAIYNAFCAYFNTYGPQTLGRELPLATRINTDVQPAPIDEAPLPFLAKRQEEQEPEVLPISPAPTPPPVNDDAEVWKIQFLTSSSRLKDNDYRFKDVKDIDFYKDKGVYKYTTGSYATLKEAKKQLKRVRKTFPDAFAVSFVGARRTGFHK